ncbi:CatB-related O-acetyltransferase [Pelosinus fermentans]|uniref:Transferase hexapeptide repeat containing protein n=1 Tax=Pelosinus fermentans JBW45 TaxID=1192197 RepID=I8TS14_9FIRM|nr:CatB-related O-acetyltransferase [Pelosinus fermentans]AJQ26019.1 transferase hexapeptide repeat containing protein [Pelosinus fermentans JBW45]
MLINIILKIYGYLRADLLRKILLKFILKVENGQAWSNTVRKIYRQYYRIEIGYGTYGGAFDYNKIASGTVFGNYCSVANNVYALNGNHPIAYFSQHPMFYNPHLKFVSEEQIQRTKLVIGHDVWIGANVIILPSVKKIGNGAVIGAGAVVTKDIEAYQVCAGNPARLIKYRFSQSVIQKLEKSEWWLLDKNNLFTSREKIQNYIK